MKPKKTRAGALTRKTPKSPERVEEKTDLNKVETHDDQGNKPKRNARKWVSGLLITFGILLILIPLIMTHINASRNDDIIDKFLADAQRAISDSQEISSEDIVTPVFNEPSEPVDSQNPVSPELETDEPGNTGEVLDSDQGEDSPTDNPAPAPVKKPTISAEEIQKRMTGVLIIDKIDLRMVIMDGVDEETLRVAAGRMTETGHFDELGNVVLAGHRSYTLGKYFNRLDELEPGDKIIVQTKSRMLEYEIYKKHIIEPDDLSITNQSDSEKILTLFTCHPVVIANQRLVVHAKQIN